MDYNIRLNDRDQMLHVADLVDERLGLYGQTISLDRVVDDKIVADVGGKGGRIRILHPVHYQIIHAPNYDGDSVLVPVSDLAKSVLTPTVVDEIKVKLKIIT